ncbi:hypothetical protein NEOKW01_1778 [Nematocida sp. AWRm80]|nr:hypothetical protein NEOKW01_1778 [Nematocida sp. AWRm80]
MLLPILFGSNGGKSYHLAVLLKQKIEETPKETFSKNITCKVIEMNSVQVDQLKNINIVIFVCSTTGDGTCPYNMLEFWQELKRVSWNNLFTHLYFAVVALGDSSFQHYNYTGKRLYNRMIQLGSTPICKRCDCDDMDPQGVYTALTDWIPLFTNSLTNILNTI